jgi:hypothetical protein
MNFVLHCLHRAGHHIHRVGTVAHHVVHAHKAITAAACLATAAPLSGYVAANFAPSPEPHVAAPRMAAALEPAIASTVPAPSVGPGMPSNGPGSPPGGPGWPTGPGPASGVPPDAVQLPVVNIAEPSTFSLLLIGLVLAGVSIRLRRRSRD